MKPDQHYTLGYRPYLDGLRGIAVIAVILRHGQSGYLPGGFLGVDIFLALSGFLITSLLIREAETSGRIKFSHFYLRRALRLLPAFGLMLAVFCGYAIWSGVPGRMMAAEILPSGLYFSNWTRAFDLGYPIYLGHTWSLSVEEQFYLIWPVVCATVLVKFDARTRIWIVIAMIAAEMTWRFTLNSSGLQYERIYNGFDTHSDGLLIGAAVACFMAMPVTPWRIRLARAASRLLPPGCLVALLLMTVAEPDNPAIYLFGNSFAAFVTALAIVAISQGEANWLRWALEWRPLVRAGQVSYGLYIWHYVIFFVMVQDFGFGPLVVNTAGVLLTLSVTLLSYRLIEQPVLRLKTRFAVA